MRKIRVAINGFGRIGRSFFKVARKCEDLEIVAINDLGEIENLAYLLKYDSVYGKSDFTVGVVTGHNQALVVEGKEVAFLSEKDPEKLPWKHMEVDVVVESTGLFRSYDKAKAHLDAGAKRVVISAPAKGQASAGVSGATVLMGINEHDLKGAEISSNASCTTNAGGPLISILHEVLGIEKALLNTIHAYTSSQAVVDSPRRDDFRRGRAAAHNIVPSSTGAAIAVTKAIPDLNDLFDGIAVRVPVLTGSLVDVTFVSKRGTTAEEVNEILTKASHDPRWKGLFTVTDEPIVSSDIIGDPHSSIADLSFTRVVGGNLVKVLAWYDNEMGYAHTLVTHVLKAGSYLE